MSCDHLSLLTVGIRYDNILRRAVQRTPLAQRLMRRQEEHAEDTSLGQEVVDATYTAVNSLQKALEIFKELADSIGVPWLKSGVAAASVVLKMVKVWITQPAECTVLTRTR